MSGPADPFPGCMQGRMCSHPIATVMNLQFAVRAPQQTVSSGRHLSSNAGIAHHKLHRHVHSGNGQGTLAAMEVLSARTGPSAGNHWEQLFQAAGITLDERRALRRFFLQVSCIPDMRLRL